MIRVLIVSVLLLCFCSNAYSQENEETGTPVFKVFKTQAEIDSMTKGSLYWKDLIKYGKIILNGCSGCEVTGFDLNIVAFKVFHGDSCSVEPKLSGTFHCDSGSFSKKIISAIEKAKEGRFTFYNIIAITPQEQEINLNPIFIYVYPTKDYYKKRIPKYRD